MCLTLVPVSSSSTVRPRSPGGDRTDEKPTPPVQPASSPGPAIARSLRRRRLAVVLALLTVLAVTALASLLFGSKQVSVADVLVAVLGGREGDAVVVADLRWPRTLLGIVAGAALGAAGDLTQAITRNPLGDPGLIGISAGGAFAVAAGIGLFGLTDPREYVWFAFVGSALAGGIAYAVGGAGAGGLTPTKLALAGAAVSVLLGSATSLLMLVDVRTLDQYRSWAVGALSGRGPTVWSDLAPVVVLGLVLALVVGRHLDAVALGDDVAATLGVSAPGVRAVGALAVILLAGASVAAIGPVTFVGLVVPHLVRAVTGASLAWSVPSSALGGAALLLGADVVGRVVVPPGELEVGVVSALIGAPFLAGLVKSGRLTEGRR